MEEFGLKFAIGGALFLLVMIATDIHSIRKMLEWRNKQLADKLYPLD